MQAEGGRGELRLLGSPIRINRQGMAGMKNDRGIFRIRIQDLVGTDG
jgi:hypothetical protein